MGINSDFPTSGKRIFFTTLTYSNDWVSTKNQTDILNQGLGSMLLLLTHLFQGIFSVRYIC